mgnify:CR=1 FL=1
MNSTVNIIINYFKGELGIKSEHLDVNTPLLDEGLLDSLAIVSIIAFIEEEFHITFADSDFDIQNFSSVGKIVELIQRSIDINKDVMV